MNDLLDFNLSRKEFLARLFWSVWKGSVLSALYFLVVWPIAIACVAREHSRFLALDLISSLDFDSDLGRRQHGGNVDADDYQARLW